MNGQWVREIAEPAFKARPGDGEVEQLGGVGILGMCSGIASAV